MHKKYILELTDNYINIYDAKKNKLFREEINPNIIVNNKIYDYLRLNRYIRLIALKYKIINNLFKSSIYILSFFEITPSEKYLIENLFKNIMDVSIKIIYPYYLFDKNHLFVSGKIVYYKNKVLDSKIKGNYVIIGYSDNIKSIKSQLETKYPVNILEYENGKTMIYLKI